MGPSRIDVQLVSVLFSKGHDGFLRGRPEPVLIVAAFALEPELRLLQSAQRQVAVTQVYPCTVQLDDSLFRVRLGAATRLALLTLAFESDSGEDIAEVTAGLAAPAQWRLRAEGAPVAPAFALSELGLLHWAGPPRGQRVQLEHSGRDLAERCTNDDWVGAGLLLLDAGTRSRRTCEQRLRGSDGRNDWTVRLHVRLS